MVIRGNNIVMVKVPQPKRVILSSSRTFMAKWERSKKKDLSPNVTITRK